MINSHDKTLKEASSLLYFNSHTFKISKRTCKQCVVGLCRSDQLSNSIFQISLTPPL